MGRIRSVKPEVCRSRTLVQVPREMRFTFVCLWTVCDDEGRVLFDAQLLASDLYPLDDQVTSGVIDDEIEALAHVGAVCIYEVAGKRYLHIPSWHEHQHPNRKLPSRLPHCSRSEHALLKQCSGSASALPVVSSGSGSGSGRGSEPSARSRAPKPSAKPKTPTPDDFDVTLSLRSWAKEAGVTANLTTETQQWLDYHRSKGSRQIDWTASWRTWMRNTLKYGSTAPTKPTQGGGW